MDSYELQAAVVAAVQARGYWNGYTPEQVLARQLGKLAEEIGEAAALVTGSPTTYLPLRSDVGAPALQALHLVGLAMRGAFDRGDWSHVQAVGDAERLWSEICDLGVVWLNLVGAWNAWQGAERDGMAGAHAKACADVRRGVR